MENIPIEDLIEPYKTIAEIIGIENTLELAQIFGGGEPVYFPQLKSLHRPARNRQIIEEFNGYNFKELAKKYDLTEMTIRYICRENIDTQRSKPMINQTTMFE